MDRLCDFFIVILQEWAGHSYYNYAAINIILFIILEPILIMTFMATTLIGCKTKNEKLKKRLSWFTYISFILCVLLTLALIIIPVIKKPELLNYL